MDTTLQTIKDLLTLGWPAIVLIQLWFMWQKYNALQDRYIDDLRTIALKMASTPAPVVNEQVPRTGSNGD